MYAILFSTKSLPSHTPGEQAFVADVVFGHVCGRIQGNLETGEGKEYNEQADAEMFGAA